jgi:hypothetical protein
MNAVPNQHRKLIYPAIIVVIFGAMYPYSNWLNRVKSEKDLGEAAIGQVDTGSFMLKLALLGGARGVAANVLWTRTEELKREQDWDRLKATVDLITKLQPHFLSVWTFQGWNLAYNVSVEWDAPEDKYEWIKKGIIFLKDGVQKNQQSPDLMWDTAWTYYHKYGYSDEAVILRRLFLDDEDDEFKSYYDPEEKRVVIRHDNFQLGYGWFVNAIDLVDHGRARVVEGTRDVIYVDPSPQRKGRPDDLAFRSMPAHAQTRYASAIEKASIMGVRARFGKFASEEWRKALDDWVKFGRHEFKTHNEVEVNGKMVKFPVFIDDVSYPAKMKTFHPNQAYWTNRWADQMNYRYWKDRAATEMTDPAVQARQLFYEGTIAYRTADFAKAVENYKLGLDKWKAILDEHPDYRNDTYNQRDTGLIVKRYVRALKQLGEDVPKSYPFMELLRRAEADNTVDPFDANEMMDVTPAESAGPTAGGAPGMPAGATPLPSGPTPAPGGASPAPAK